MIGTTLGPTASRANLAPAGWARSTSQTAACVLDAGDLTRSLVCSYVPMSSTRRWLMERKQLGASWLRLEHLGTPAFAVTAASRSARRRDGGVSGARKGVVAR